MDQTLSWKLLLEECSACRPFRVFLVWSVFHPAQAEALSLCISSSPCLLKESFVPSYSLYSWRTSSKCSVSASSSSVVCGWTYVGDQVSKAVVVGHVDRLIVETGAISEASSIPLCLPACFSCFVLSFAHQAVSFGPAGFFATRRMQENDDSTVTLQAASLNRGCPNQRSVRLFV